MRTDALTPVLAEQLWQALHVFRRSESGRPFLGVLVRSAPWVLWDAAAGRVECERCGRSDAMAAPVGRPSPAEVVRISERLGPFRDEHARCARPQ